MVFEDFGSAIQSLMNNLGIALVVGMQVCNLKYFIDAQVLTSASSRSDLVYCELYLIDSCSLARSNMHSSSPGIVVANTHTVGASLAVWLASGILGWTGASSFAELGSAIPQDGGAQAYLAYAYGPLVAYLFAWTAIVALRPGIYLCTKTFFPPVLNNSILGGNAVISLIFAEYLNRIFFHSTRAEISPDDIPTWAIKLTASLAVLVVAAFCVWNRQLGARAAVVFTSVKVRE